MSPLVVVLAAGLGTRMRSKKSKVLHELCGRPMVCWAVDTAQKAGCEVLAVLHYQEELVKKVIPGVKTVRQDVPKGTGDAVKAALENIKEHEVVIVLPGDAPLIKPELIKHLLNEHQDALCTVVSTIVSDPSAYGRIVRNGDTIKIVEASEASPEELEINEVNAGIYAFNAKWLADEVLPALKPHKPKDEFYITDAVEMAAQKGGLKAILEPDWQSLQGINDKYALAVAEEALQNELLKRHMLAGVTIQRPVRIEANVRIAAGVTIKPGSVLEGETIIEEDVIIGPNCYIVDSYIKANAVIKSGSVLEKAEVGANAQVGPMAHIRPRSVLGNNSKVGNFVETKNVNLGEGTKASHLTYLGDAKIGAGTNIGAGTITCNYDGFSKNETIIGEGCFIGSNSSFVAPVVVSDNAMIGAGSVITGFVPKDALAVARCKQMNYPDAANRLKDQYRDRAKSKK